jgi:hypothetical protein
VPLWDQEAIQAREVLVLDQEAIQAREVLVLDQEAIQAREVLVLDQEARSVVVQGQVATQRRQVLFGVKNPRSRRSPRSNLERESPRLENPDSRLLTLEPQPPCNS